MNKSMINETKRMPVIIAVVILSAILILLFVSSNDIFQFWRYKDGVDCYKQNVGKIKLKDARQVLVQACYFGYGEEDGTEYDYELKKAGRCVVRNISRFFNINSGLEVINECTGENGKLYSMLESYLLLESQIRELEASQEAERIASIRRQIEMRMALDILKNQ